MELVNYSEPARNIKKGRESGIIINAGQRFIIETSPGGEDILGETVPAGKTWTVHISVSIVEI